MTIWQTLRSGLRQKGKYKQHWVRPAGEAAKPPETRQVVRRAIAAHAQIAVSEKNPDMLRADRRKLVKAYAAAGWSQHQLARLRKAAASV